MSTRAEDLVGCRVDDLYGGRVGRACALYFDVHSDEPLWLLVRTGRSRPAYRVVPVDACSHGNGRVWAPFPRGQILLSAPITPSRAISPRIEATLCHHYDVALTPGARSGAWLRSALYALGDWRDDGAWAAMRATPHPPQSPCPEPALFA